MEFTLFCRKFCFAAIYAVLLRNLFCRGLRTFCVETNHGQNVVRGEKMTYIMYACLIISNLQTVFLDINKQRDDDAVQREEGKLKLKWFESSPSCAELSCCCGGNGAKVTTLFRPQLSNTSDYHFFLFYNLPAWWCETPDVIFVTSITGSITSSACVKLLALS